MKHLCIFLFVLVMPFGVMADDGFYTADAQKIVDSSTDFAESIRGDYAELEQEILKVDPAFAKILNSQSYKWMDDSQKIIVMRSYLAQKAFDYYRDAFVAELEQRSKETGRKIVTEKHDLNDKYNIRRSIDSMWLDRGELDLDKCQKDGWQICKYPDGFEDVVIILSDERKTDEYGVNALLGNNLYGKEIIYHKDMPKQNAWQYCVIGLQYESVTANRTTNSTNKQSVEDDFVLIVNCQVEKYDEHHAWRNQEVEDVKNGKYEVIGWEDYGGPFGKVAILKNDEYKSDYLPAAYVISGLFDYGSSVDKTTTKTTK